MCNLSVGVEEKGIAKGVAKAYLACIRCLVENMSMSAEKAMSVPEVPEAERHKYLEMLEQKE